MESLVYGNLKSEGIEVVARDGRYFVRYDAGAHQIVWREDELTESELASIKLGGSAQREAMFHMQRRLERSGVNAYSQNWTPHA
jgi:hypothetical protein